MLLHRFQLLLLAGFAAALAATGPSRASSRPPVLPMTSPHERTAPEPDGARRARDDDERAAASPDERAAGARRSEARVHERALAAMPERGWTSARTERALLIAARECGSLRRIEGRVDALLDWLDDTFAELRVVPHTRAPVIRVFPSTDALLEYEPPADLDLEGLEVLACMEAELPELFDLSVNGDLLFFWLDEHAGGLQSDLPLELNLGLRLWVGQAKFGGRKISPPPMDIYLESLRADLAAGRALDLRGALTSADSNLEEDELDEDGPEVPGSRGVLLVDHLLGSRKRLSRPSAAARELLPRFLRAIVAARAEFDAADRPPSTTVEALEAEREAILEAAFAATFGAWSAEEWSAFEVSFRKAHRLR